MEDLDIFSYFSFQKLYRKLTGITLGGTKPTKNYNSITLDKVCSVGEKDSYNNVPFRIPLSNFALGSSIISYGCILRHSSTKYLLLRRSSTIEYLDFIRGNYRTSNLYFLIVALSDQERSSVIQQPFETLWTSLFGRLIKNETYLMAAEKFNLIHPHLSEIFLEFPSQDPLGKSAWIFPKGRLDYIYSLPQTPTTYCPPSNTMSSPTGSFEYEANVTSETTKFLGNLIETPLQCALREFTEETNGLVIKDSQSLFPHPIVESYMGTNNKNYTTRFFVFGTDDLLELTKPTTDNLEELRWVDYTELSEYLIPRRLGIIENIESEVKGYTKIDGKWSS